jgi:hypothetical protein
MKRFLNDIKGILPSDRVYTDELRTLAWGTDASFYRLTPQVVIRAKDEDEVAAIVRAANRYGLPFTFRAAGTSLSGQSVSDSILIVAGKNWEDYSDKEKFGTMVYKNSEGRWVSSGSPIFKGEDRDWIDSRVIFD